MVQSLAVLEKSPGLVRTGPGLVRLKVEHVRTGSELTSPWESLAVLEFKFLSVRDPKTGVP